MRKRCCRYFGGLISAQERWLNKMAAEGWRLMRTGKLSYDFQKCALGQYEYRVEYVAHKSRQDADGYARFLEDCGYRVFFKNYNLNWSVGKLEVRPWADSGGRLATRATTYDRELLIVEKAADGKPFELHTSNEDRRSCVRALMRPWLFLFALSAVLGLVLRSPAWGLVAAASLAGTLVHAARLLRIKKDDE